MPNKESQNRLFLATMTRLSLQEAKIKCSEIQVPFMTVGETSWLEVSQCDPQLITTSKQ